METLDKYYDKFNSFPPLPYTYNYDDKEIIKKMEEAIKKNKPLTMDDYEDLEQEGIKEK